MNKYKALAIILQLAIVGLADAATIESFVSGNWNVGATWVGGIVPLPGDNVVIKNTHTVNITANHSIVSITVEAGASIIVDATFSLTTTGDIIQDGTFSVNGILNLDGGTHAINVASSFSGTGIININNTNIINSSVGWAPAINTVNHIGEIFGNVAITIQTTTTWNWSSGRFGGSGNITNNGTLNIYGSAALHNTATDIINSGTINWTGGHLDLGSGDQTLTNNASGIFICNVNYDVDFNGACNLFINNIGTFNRTTTGTALLSQAFNNLTGGTVLISSGGLTVFWVTQSGTFTVNGTLNLNGGAHTINVADSFSGSGVINLNGANTINSSVGWTPAIDTVNHIGAIYGTAEITIPTSTTWNWSSGIFGDPGNITNNGTINTSSQNDHIYDGDIINYGNFNWTGGILGQTGSFFINKSTGTLNITPISPITCTSHSTIQNTGTINMDDLGSTFFSDFDMSGGEIICSGTNCGIEIQGVFNWSGGEINQVDCTFLNGLTCSGNVTLSDASLGPGFSFNNFVTISSGAILTMDNSSFGGFAQLNIETGSILNGGGGGSMGFPVVIKTGTGTFHIDVDVTYQDGNIDIQEGTLDLNGALIFDDDDPAYIKGNGTLDLIDANYNHISNYYSYFSPGASPGTLTVLGNYNESLEIEIEEVNNIISHDLLIVSGDATLTDKALNVYDSGIIPGGSWVILTANNIIGQFDGGYLPACFELEYTDSTVILKKIGKIKTWDGSIGNWSDAISWIPDGVPCPLDTVIIPSGIVSLDIQPEMAILTLSGGQILNDILDADINAPFYVSVGAFVNIAALTTLDVNGIFCNDGTIQGYGTIDITNATISNTCYGKWAPGNSTGVLGCKGTYNNEVIEMEIQGPGNGGGTVEVDFLSVSQTMVVNEDLIVLWLGGTIPPGIRTIMECDGGVGCRTDTFNTVTFPPQCPPGKCSIIYTPNQVQLINTEPIEFQGTCTWLGGSGNWSAVNKWSCNDVPNANDDVVINSGVVTLDIPTTVKSLNITGGSVIGSNNLSVTNSFLWSGGSFSAGADFSVGAATLSGNISLSNTSIILSQGGTFNNPTLTLSSNASIILPATKTLTLNNQGTINNDNGFNFVNNGTIIKNGSGVFTLKNPFVNNGITNITAGTIKYDNNFSSTGLLKGNGFIDFTAAGNVQIGPVNPGSSPGTFHVTGNYTNKHYLAEMLHSASVTTHDRIDVTSNIQLQDSITIIKLAGEDIPYGTYTLMHCDGSASCITGNFVTVKYPAFCGGADCSLLISGQDVKFVFQASLPVELSAFDARKLGSSVRLDWTTSSEVNVREFIIERSSNTAAWAELGSISARGNSTESLNYFYSDNDPVDGNNFYRLRIIDQDGSFKYSPIVNVAFESAGNMQLFPNPVNQILTIRPPSNAEGNLWIVNSSGQTVIRQSLIPSEEVSINVANLPAGLYAVCIPGIPCKSFVKE